MMLRIDSEMNAAGNPGGRVAVRQQSESMYRKPEINRKVRLTVAIVIKFGCLLPGSLPDAAAQVARLTPTAIVGSQKSSCRIVNAG